MIASCRNRYHVTQSAGHSGLATPIVSPCDDGSVLLECQAVSVSCRNRYHRTQSAGHGSLAGVILSPRDHGSVLLERQAVIVSSRNRYDTTQPARHCVGIASPCHYRSILLEG